MDPGGDEMPPESNRSPRLTPAQERQQRSALRAQRALRRQIRESLRPPSPARVFSVSPPEADLWQSRRRIRYRDADGFVPPAPPSPPSPEFSSQDNFPMLHQQVPDMYELMNQVVRDGGDIVQTLRQIMNLFTRSQNGEDISNIAALAPLIPRATDVEPVTTWGDCPMCYDPPIDPHGCNFCLQFIGCKVCIRNWNIRSRVPSCPLCRHTWGGAPDISSMTEIDSRRRNTAYQTTGATASQ
ncbi:unnamed protein product [Caenorhabditis sp. 36 PRJEB53466]|nr:unnamed protein product [Caenorhabditis sp. 36 PRJEB53466]